LITRVHRPFFGLAVMLLFVTASVFGQAQAPAEQPKKPEKIAQSYGLGDQMLSLSLGVFVPLFFQGGPNGIMPTNLSLGGAGSLMWSSFLNNNWAIGLDVAGSFSFSPNGRTLFLVSIAPRISYFFHSYPFDIPVFLDAGINFSQLSTSFKVDPVLKPGVGILWNYTPNWSFGANLTYWWIPQIYPSGGQIPSTDTRLGNFADVSITALYHF